MEFISPGHPCWALICASAKISSSFPTLHPFISAHGLRAAEATAQVLTTYGLQSSYPMQAARDLTMQMSETNSSYLCGTGAAVGVNGAVFRTSHKSTAVAKDKVEAFSLSNKAFRAIMRSHEMVCLTLCTRYLHYRPAQPICSYKLWCQYFWAWAARADDACKSIPFFGKLCNMHHVHHIQYEMQPLLSFVASKLLSQREGSLLSQIFWAFRKCFLIRQDIFTCLLSRAQALFCMNE
jgi:hypothetical protein